MTQMTYVQTYQLRWRQVSKGEPGALESKGEHYVLEQLWQGSDGSRKWITVPRLDAKKD